MGFLRKLFGPKNKCEGCGTVVNDSSDLVKVKIVVVSTGETKRMNLCRQCVARLEALQEASM